jgi:hypothetical protein
VSQATAWATRTIIGSRDDETFESSDLILMLHGLMQAHTCELRMISSTAHTPPHVRFGMAAGDPTQELACAD